MESEWSKLLFASVLFYTSREYYCEEQVGAVGHCNSGFLFSFFSLASIFSLLDVKDLKNV